MDDATTLKVFTDEAGEYGDVVPIIVDEGRRILPEERLQVASATDAAEVVFINDSAGRDISVVHEHGEIDFAGTAALAAARFLSDEAGIHVTSMRSQGGPITVRQDGSLVWVCVGASSLPGWNLRQLGDVAAVERLKPEELRDLEHTVFWCWADRSRGLVRARTFAADWGIDEAKTNGSGAMMLANALNEEIEVAHGDGSMIYAKPETEGIVCLGGRVSD